MTSTSETLSGKGHRDENFPVASLFAAKHRKSVLAYYRFARAADDVADHESLPEDRKLELLDSLEATLLGRSDSESEALPLRAVLAETGLNARHALDLLVAFRMDVTKRRYTDWAELIEYCRYSAAPVGRFVLDVHGESQATWPANDALCSALQIVNHLQDCGKDYKTIDRVYLPQDTLRLHGVGVEALGADKASPALLASIQELATKTGDLLATSAAFSPMISNLRLGLNVAVIQRLAEHLNNGLMKRDPLSETVHHSKLQFAGIGLVAALKFGVSRLCGRRAIPIEAQRKADAA